MLSPCSAAMSAWREVRALGTAPMMGLEPSEVAAGRRAVAKRAEALILRARSERANPHLQRAQLDPIAQAVDPDKTDRPGGSRFAGDLDYRSAFHNCCRTRSSVSTSGPTASGRRSPERKSGSGR